MNESKKPDKKQLTPKEQFDQYFDKNEEQAKAQFYQNKSMLLIIKILIIIVLFLDIISFVLSLIYHEVDVFGVVGMFAIIVFQILFWLCFLKEKCFYYFRKGIANYYYQAVIWATYLF